MSKARSLRVSVAMMANALACLVLSAHAQAGQNAEAVMRAVCKKLGSATDIDIRYTIAWDEGGSKGSQSGRIQARRNGQFRVVGEKPARLQVVSDGKTIYLPVPESRQYSAIRLDADRKALRRFGFLPQVAIFYFAGRPDMLGDFVPGAGPPEMLAPRTVGGENMRVIRYRSTEGPETLVLFVNRNDLPVRAEFKEDLLSGSLSNTFIARRIVLNGHAGSRLFAYSPPGDYKRMPDDPYTDRLLKVGSVAPEFSLKDASSGEIVTLAKALEGKKAVLVNFWSYE